MNAILGALHPAINFLGNLLPVSDDNISFDFKVKKFLSGIGYPRWHPEFCLARLLFISRFRESLIS